MKRILSAVMAALVLFGLTGCAETPEAMVVTQKDQEQMIERANSLEDNSSTIAQQVNAPERVQDSFTNSDGVFTVTVDALVTFLRAFTTILHLFLSAWCKIAGKRM